MYTVIFSFTAIVSECSINLSLRESILQPVPIVDGREDWEMVEAEGFLVLPEMVCSHAFTSGTRRSVSSAENGLLLQLVKSTN